MNYAKGKFPIAVIQLQSNIPLDFITFLTPGKKARAIKLGANY